jgi:hypothetical protein
MGVLIRLRQRPSTREAFEAEARAQEARRPPTRPRAPPVADQKHSAPLWSEHLHTYVSYSWREHNWRRWSTIAKLWKVIPDINVVIRAESKIHEAAIGGKNQMPERPKGMDYSEPLWYQTERLWVSYNSFSGNWMEWYGHEWVDTRTSDWTQMPVMTKTEEKDGELPKAEEEKPLETTSSTPSQGSVQGAETAKDLLADISVAEQNQKAAEAPQREKMTLARWLKFERRKSVAGNVLYGLWS